MTQPSRALFVTLWAKKRKGGLASIAPDEGTISLPKRTKAARKNRPKTRVPRQSSKTSSETSISPDLATFMATKPEGSSSPDSERESSTPVVVETSAVSAASYTEFEPEQPSTDNPRRIKQSERQQLQQRNAQEISAVLKELEECLEGKNNLDEILAVVGKLVNRESLNKFGSLLKTRQPINYRLSWVGSDAMICDVGTALHKVALARLQEVFLSLSGRNQVQLLEVISVLGPFPNVRNTLDGTCSAKNELLDITWTSMIDGTGREILAGKEENTKTVQLEVFYGDEQVIVAGRPSSNPLEAPEDLLVFVVENDMEAALEKLRVN